MSNENSEILQMLLSEDDDDVHLALILIMEGKVKVSREEINVFYRHRDDMMVGRALYNKVIDWINGVHGHLYRRLEKLADKSQELSNQ